jgi:ParB/RepB/Spo0J family partition protein
MREAEIESISRKYESLRRRDKSREKDLLLSILEHGVREPLQCVEEGEQRYVLLDGFKRLRCSHKLKLHMVPVVSLGNDEVSSILQLIRLSAERSLSTLEQAGFVDELHKGHGLTVGEIAAGLERSKAWVSVRLGIIDEMSEVVREAVFSGRFPLRSYMYTVRQFTRVNGVSGREIDGFVRSVSGQELSIRDIETLAYGYFRGAEALKRQIEEGNLIWTVRQMRRSESTSQADEGFSEAEWSVIGDLELARKCIGRLRRALAREQELSSRAFHARGLLLVEGLLAEIEVFETQLRSFHENRTRQASGQNAL